MGRKERRIQKKFEKNPIRELNKVQNRFYSQLFWKFSQTEDPRHPSYITYTNRMMLGTLYYKGIAGIDSMQEMTEKFNDEAVSKNLSVFMGETAKEYVPPPCDRECISGETGSKGAGRDQAGSGVSFNPKAML